MTEDIFYNLFGLVLALLFGVAEVYAGVLKWEYQEQRPSEWVRNEIEDTGREFWERRDYWENNR